MSVYCRPLKAPAVEGEKNAPIMFVKVRTSTKSCDWNEHVMTQIPWYPASFPVLCEPGNETTRHGDTVEYPCVCVRYIFLCYNSFQFLNCVPVQMPYGSHTSFVVRAVLLNPSLSCVCRVLPRVSWTAATLYEWTDQSGSTSRLRSKSRFWMWSRSTAPVSKGERMAGCEGLTVYISIVCV